MADDAGWAMVDGALTPLRDATIPATDPGLLLGWTVFETLTARDGEPDRPGPHLRRLRASAEAARVPFPDEATLAAELRAVAARQGGAVRLRVTLTAGGHRLLFATPLDPSRRHQPVRAATGPHRDEPFLGGRVKHGSRAPWAVAVARAGVDEVLLVDADGRFTEGTTSGVVAVVDGALWIAPDDGRVLASTTLDDLIARAHAAHIPVHREGAPAAGPWQGLYIASSTRDIAPVIELDGRPLPGWEPVGRALASAQPTPRRHDAQRS
jgi:branched-chain amino acid aminotransferase